MSRLRLREVDAEEELDEDEVEVTTCKPWGPTEDEESTDMTLAANIRFVYVGSNDRNCRVQISSASV